MDSLQIYAKTVFVEADAGNTVLVTLNDIDLGDVVSEAGTTQLLEQMDLSDVHDWVQKKLEEDNGED